jgi:transposase-like protein
VPSDLGQVNWKLGSVAKVADHYDVPRQIVRGWVKLLCEGGSLPDPWSGSARRRK